ncbi:MAG: hypothetical protein E7C50_00470 [Clostridium sp.]|nr:hypothetical protein [Clostridium sp.]MDU2674239.1 hypothetical protein [Clostridium sp.]MDU2680333.1 hypothetical protein [Clostridium sp.]
MVKIVLVIIGIILLFMLLGTWCCLVVGSRCEQEYRENKERLK